jgi:hypothetical protein
MQRLEVSGEVRPLQWSLGVKGLNLVHVSILSAFIILQAAGKVELETKLIQQHFHSWKCQFISR